MYIKVEIVRFILILFLILISKQGTLMQKKLLFVCILMVQLYGKESGRRRLCSETLLEGVKGQLLNDLENAGFGQGSIMYQTVSAFSVAKISKTLSPLKNLDEENFDPSALIKIYNKGRLVGDLKVEQISHSLVLYQKITAERGSACVRIIGNGQRSRRNSNSYGDLPISELSLRK
jgi:hypothetical protein